MNLKTSFKYKQAYLETNLLYFVITNTEVKPENISGLSILNIYFCQNSSQGKQIICKLMLISCRFQNECYSIYSHDANIKAFYAIRFITYLKLVFYYNFIQQSSVYYVQYYYLNNYII